MYECFNVSLDGHIAHIELCRPDKRNSMIAAFWSELYAIVDKLDRQAKARVMVFTSTGPHFSSGIDISVFKSVAARSASAHPEVDRPEPEPDGADGTDKAVRFYTTVQRLQRTFTRIEQCRIPVLVAVQGGCIGAGLDMVTACDCRYATNDAYFTIYETNLAMTADVGTFPRLSKLMPDGLVRELAYTGRRLSADQALASGLINNVYDSQQSMVDGVMEIAATIASRAPMAVAGCKRMILHARDHRVADTLDHVALWNSAFFSHRDMLEAFAAQSEKRDGRFSAIPTLHSEDDTDAGIDL
jgi:enoyl-CoA hydratase